MLRLPLQFACSNTSYMPLALSGKSVVAKLKAYFEWSKTDPKMIAINPWHFNHRHSAQHAPPCDMELGAINIPGVVAELTKIGAWIKAQPQQ